MKYDYTIVGTGPTGLTIATLLINAYPTSKILILDKHSYLGGDNGVNRGPNNEFTEHSPRFQSGAYVNFKTILNDMGMEFNDLFTEYSFPIRRLFPAVYNLSIPTITRLTIGFISFLLNNDYGNDVPVVDIADGNKGDISFLNQITRLVDGGTVYNSRLNQLFQIINQNMLYGMYQPTETTDTGLFKQWGDFLVDNGVEIELNIDVTDLNALKKKSKKVILAIPPTALSKLIPSYEEIAKDTAYSKYKPITFHWKKKYNIPTPSDYNDLGIISIPISNYTYDPVSPYKTVISSVISNVDDYEGIEQAYSQLKQSIPYLNSIPPPDEILSNDDNDVTYFNSIFSTPIKFKTPVKNVYTVGTHNLKSQYDFTSIESAVTNAVAFGDFIGIRKDLKYGWTLREVFLIIVVLIIMGVSAVYVLKY